MAFPVRAVGCVLFFLTAFLLCTAIYSTTNTYRARYGPRTVSGRMVPSPSEPPGPFVSGDWFRSIADHVIISDGQAKRFAMNLTIAEKSIIFLKTDLLRHLPAFQKRNHLPYILITHDSALSAPGVYSKCLDDPHLIRWFSQNMASSHPKMRALPLGIANMKWPHGDQILLGAKRKERLPMVKRPFLLYANYANHTNSARSVISRLFCSNNSTLNATCVTARLPWSAYLSQLARSQFVISPPGKGIDCHRTWESIAMGAIPIVLNSSISSLYKDEPVLVVESFQQVTSRLLDETLSLYQPRLSEYRGRLYRSYWRREFTNYLK